MTPGTATALLNGLIALLEEQRQGATMKIVIDVATCFMQEPEFMFELFDAPERGLLTGAKPNPFLAYLHDYEEALSEGPVP